MNAEAIHSRELVVSFFVLFVLTTEGFRGK